MKNIYIAALIASAMTIPATAATEDRQQMDSTLSSVSLQKKSQRMSGTFAPKFTDIYQMAGKYEVTCHDCLKHHETSYIWTLDIEDASKDEISISGLRGNLTVRGTVDLQTGTVTIKSHQKLGEDKTGEIFFYIKEYGNDGSLIPGASSHTETIGVIDNYTITFPSGQLWATGDPNDEAPGWFMVSDCVTMAHHELEDFNRGWHDVGTATFIDGWIIPAIYDDPENYPWTVNVQENDNISGLYRIDNPYSAETCPVRDILGAERGYVVFDISDPDIVLVLAENFSGVINGGNRIYNTNIEAYLALSNSKEDLKAALPNEIGSISTYDSETKTIYFENCRFMIPNNNEPCSLSGNISKKMHGRLSFDVDPSGSCPAVTDDNMPVEYYTLWGTRITNPLPGTIVIRRQGSEVTKVLVNEIASNLY